MSRMTDRTLEPSRTESVSHEVASETFIRRQGARHDITLVIGIPRPGSPATPVKSLLDSHARHRHHPLDGDCSTSVQVAQRWQRFTTHQCGRLLLWQAR
jgi:hypothetical protein